MGKLRFGMMASLDGYISDADGKFDWGQVSEEVHRFAEQEQTNEGITIYGRRMFETMAVWDALAADPTVSQFVRDFAVAWQNTDKIVVSRSLPEVTTTRTRLVRELNADDIRKLKTESPQDIGVAGPTLAASYLKQGLIDEVSVYCIPVVVGSGTPMFPHIDTRVRLSRIGQHAFGNGVTFTRYAVRR